MKFPIAGTEARIVLEHLFEVKTASLDEIRIALDGQVPASRVSTILSRRSEAGHAMRKGEKWVLTSKANKELSKEPAPVLEIVPSRYVPTQRPLNPSRYLNPMGSRPGSNDLRSVQSLY